MSLGKFGAGSDFSVTGKSKNIYNKIISNKASRPSSAKLFRCLVFMNNYVV